MPRTHPTLFRLISRARPRSRPCTASTRHFRPAPPSARPPPLSAPPNRAPRHPAIHLTFKRVGMVLGLLSLPYLVVEYCRATREAEQMAASDRREAERNRREVERDRREEERDRREEERDSRLGEAVDLAKKVMEKLSGGSQVELWQRKCVFVFG